VARSKRRTRSWLRAFRFFLLAALTLLVAGFIAHGEIPFLMGSGIDVVVPHRAPAANAKRHGLVAGGENLHPSTTPADEDDNAAQVAPASAIQRRSSPGKGSTTEEITGSERQQLGELIKERSR
jgi:hypothetical protein